MIELKPCPFCGLEPVYGSFNRPVRYWLYCPNKNCEVHPVTKMYNTQKEAAEAWNRRFERGL